MKSIKILTSYRILDITRIQTSSTFIKAYGDDFSRTKFVIINGAITTNFALNANYILVYPPEGVSISDVKSIVVVAESQSIDDKSLMKLGLGYTIGSVEGVDRLAQLFVFTLLTTPGSYILDKTRGGGLLAVMRKGAGNRVDAILPDLVAAIRKTERDIKAMQAGLKLPGNELLLGVTVLSTSVHPSDLSVNAFVELVTLNGKRRAFNVGI